MPEPLHVLSAGAAKRLVEALEPAFRAATGTAIASEFGAVGAIRQRLLAGAPCDVVILTEPLLDDLIERGHVAAPTAAALGRVFTGIAVKCGAPHPAIADRAALRAAIAAAPVLYCPDIVQSTAGLHCVEVLRVLELWPAHEPRLRVYPSGGIAMRAMADAPEPAALGCTQVTEILYTPGVELVGVLPREFELSTMYTVGVASRAMQPKFAQLLAEMLAGPEAAALRSEGGFT